MYAIQMTNSANETELCVLLFSTRKEAQQHAEKYFTDYDNYVIVKMQKHS